LKSAKVMRAIARLNIGGPARHAVILNAQLAAHGFESVLVHGTPTEDEGSFEELGVRAGIRTIRVPGLGRRIGFANDVAAFVSLLQLLRRERPDILHTHTAKAGTLARVAAVLFNLTRARSNRIILVHTFHGHVLTGYFSGAVSAAVRFAERTLARWTDQIVTISQRQRDDIVVRFRIADAGKVSVIPLGLELDALLNAPARDVALRETLGWTDEHFVVTYVGRLVPIKDVGTLLAGFAAFAAGNAKARLLIVGDGEERSRLESRVGELGLREVVVFVGWQTDLTRIYGAADVVALTSLNEGTPVAVIEAMAAGLPVIATAVGGVPDVVVHGTSGLLIPPSDSGELARGLQCLAGDRDLRQRLGSEGRASVANRFHQRRLVTDMAGLYRRVLQQRDERVRG
jgi:glycosyltransferase involved in cell wall biosynthesis